MTLLRRNTAALEFDDRAQAAVNEARTQNALAQNFKLKRAPETSQAPENGKAAGVEQHVQNTVGPLVDAIAEMPEVHEYDDDELADDVAKAQGEPKAQ